MKLFIDPFKRLLFWTLVACPFLISESILAQGASTYVSPTASASGMTTGLENGSTSATMNMMQVRAAAHEADRSAAAAAMARTAESAIEEQGLKVALDKARRTRQAKIQASERLKWQKVTAYNAYNRVSSREMSTWKDQNGNVKVGRGLPSDFVNAVQKEEAARAAANPRQKKGFTPLKTLSDKVIKAVGVDEPISQTGLSSPKPLPPAPVEGPKKRFGFPKIRAPKLPFIGNRNSAPAPAPQEAPAPPQQQYAASPPRRAPQTRPAPTPAPTASATAAPLSAPAKPKPVKIKQSRSAANMIRPTQAEPQKVAGNSVIGNLFSRNKNSDPKPASTRKFGFGKKKPSVPEPIISSGLFPSGIVPGQPTTSTPKVSRPSNSNRTIVSLPGSQPEPKKKRFSLPVPKLPSPRSVSKASSGVSPTTTTNRNGNDFYVVNASSQFMMYGKTRTETKISAVRPGTVVKMTKLGADWATVQLQDGSSGIIQTKNLSGASASGFGR